MKALLNNVSAKAVLYRMAILWAIFFSVNSLGSAIMVALAGTEWENCDTQTKFLIYVAIAVNWTNTLIAYLNKGIAAMADSPDLISGIKKIETTQTEVTKTTAT